MLPVAALELDFDLKSVIFVIKALEFIRTFESSNGAKRDLPLIGIQRSRIIKAELQICEMHAILPPRF